MTLQLFRRTWRANRPWLLAAIVYFGLRALYGFADEGAGPLSPSGRVDRMGVLFLFVVLALRLVVIFVVPALLVYRLVRSGPDTRSR